MWGSNCLMCPRPHPTACSSVAQTFGTRSCSFKNRALARDVLKTSTCFYRFLRISIKKIQALAFKVLLVGGVDTELVAPIFENRAPVRDVLKIPFSKIALPRGTIRFFGRFDDVCIFKNRAPARDILKISSVYLHQNR